MLPRFLAVSLLGAAFAMPVSAAERVLKVDPAQSRVEIAVRVTADSFVAKLNNYESSVTLSEEGRPTAARFTFHFRDIATGKKGRDEAMHRWQQTDTHPDGVFELTSLEAGTGNAFTAYGRLTLHGVTRDVRFAASVTHEGDRYAIDGDAPVDTGEFGLPVIRMLGLLKVDPVVHVRFHLQGAAPSRPEAAR